MLPINPVQAFRVGDVVFGDVTPDGPDAGECRGSAVQRLGPQCADHRGRIDLPALAFVFDHVGGLPFYASVRSPTIQSRLSISAQGNVDVDAQLFATARLVMRDESFGTTEVALTGATGETVCVGVARNARVGRSAGGEELLAAARAPELDDDHVALPPGIPSDLDGASIVDEIASGVRPAGPIVEFLNGRIEIRELPGTGGTPATGLRFIAGTQSWMGNMFGTMHGGVIATILGQACSLVGQAHAPAGRDYRVGDLTASFLRSPAVDGRDVTVDVTPVRVGRRIASLSAVMNSADGQLLAAATSDIQYF